MEEGWVGGWGGGGAGGDRLPGMLAGETLISASAEPNSKDA